MGNCGGKTPKESDDMERGPPSEASLMKKAELKCILDADSIKREDGETWFVVEAAWVQRWLAFVQGDDTAKKPGPIRNESLLIYNKEGKAWVPKPLLRAARREHMGHYRRVNRHVWELWAASYRGSGPAMWVETPPFENTANWKVDPEFEGVTKGRGRAGGGDRRLGNGGNGANGGVGGGGAGGGGGAAMYAGDRVWPSSKTDLAIGEMEDEGIGNENTAQAAAFFDVALESPRISQGASAAVASASSARNGTSSGVNGGRGVTGSSGITVGGRRSTTPGKGDVESRRSSAAEVWMYGGVEGPME